jgi:putative phage-type endonuclease
MFNVDCRDSDQTLAKIESKLNLSLKTNPIQDKSNDMDAGSDNDESDNDGLDNDGSDIEDVRPAKKLISKSAQATKTPAKGGFGNLSSMKKIINLGSDNDDIDTKSVKKIIKSVQKKDDLDETSVDKKKSNVTSSTRNTSLFAKATIKTDPVKGVKNDVKPVKKGGFGVFNKTLIQGCQKNCDDNKKPSSIMKKYTGFGSLGNNNGYQYPKENKYTGVIRNDPIYGPYGTDSYHQDNMQDDQILDSISHRIEIYRKLESRHYPAQRSPEWFKMRDEITTASDGGTVVGLNPYEQIFGFITKKVHGKPFETSVDCYHGKKYEQVATMSYEYRMNVKVKEFGLCRHPKYNFLGASPDGIVSEYKLKTKDGRSWDNIEAELTMIEDWEDKRKFMAEFGIKTKFVGRMLEIKCPMRRKILMTSDAIEVYGTHGEKITDIKKDSKKGICPTYYWVQVQLQLQCCELDECDFWQCEIWEYADKEDFIGDTDTTHPWLSRQTGHEKGVVIQLMPYEQLNNKTMEYKDRIYNFASFIYQPQMDMTPLEIDQWICDTLQNLKNTHKGLVFERVLYWKIVTTRNITIKRDDKWFADNLETFRQIWEYVKYFRANKDKSILLKKYINTFPLDYYKKIKEGKNKGIIMKTIQTMCNEPSKDAPINEHKAYAKIIATIKKEIEESNVDQPKEYDITNDINYIKEALSLKIPDDMEDEAKEEQMKKFVEFIKQTKNSVQSYLYQENE